jgi:hypothetical protein
VNLPFGDEYKIAVPGIGGIISPEEEPAIEHAANNATDTAKALLPMVSPTLFEHFWRCLA